MDKSLYSPEYEALISLLRDVRLEQGLSQVQLAKRIEEPQPFVSRYEVGGRRLDFVEVWRLCGALGVPFAAFVERFERVVAESGNGR